VHDAPTPDILSSVFSLVGEFACRGCHNSKK
jgi:hypothetical protein